MSHEIREESKQDKLKDTVNLYARLLNISKEGLRFFERKGIINPERDPQTGYRIYGLDETTTVIACRKYRKYGFRLDDAADLIHEPSSAAVLERLNAQHAMLEREIEEKRRILASLAGKIEQVTDLSFSKDMYQIVTRPPMYWIPTRRNKDILDAPKEVSLTRRWNGFTPYTDVVIIWSLEHLLTQNGDIYAGHVIEKSAVHNLPIYGASYLPEAKCLYSVREVKEYVPASTQLFEDMLSYMKKHNITPAGDGLARIVRSHIDENNAYYYHFQLWIPVL